MHVFALWKPFPKPEYHYKLVWTLSPVILFVCVSGCSLVTTSGLTGLVQMRGLEELELTNCPGATKDVCNYLKDNMPKCLIIDWPTFVATHQRYELHLIGWSLSHDLLWLSVIGSTMMSHGYRWIWMVYKESDVCVIDMILSQDRWSLPRCVCHMRWVIHLCVAVYWRNR